MAADVHTLPAGSPVPVDDGATDHLRGAAVPSLALPATSGEVMGLTVAGGGPTTLIRRMPWYLEGARIARVWYPVFPPDRNAETVLAWPRSEGRR